jgi:hypothetical protein
MQSSPRQTGRGNQNYIIGYHPVVHARQGLMLGIRQPLDGPIFEKLEDAQNWCIHAMISHYDRRLGMSDASITPFKSMAYCGPPPDPSRLREIARIYEQVRKTKGSGP